MKKIHITTLGCKVNQYESASFHSRFEELGHEIVSSGMDTDIIVINTCCVTGKAGAQSRQAVRRALRQHPQAEIVVTGCLTETASTELAAMDELQGRTFSIIGNGAKDTLVETALQGKPSLKVLQNPVARQEKISNLPIRQFSSRTRAYLRIQDGCNSFCSYCIVPTTRGRSRSLPIKEVMKQAGIFAGSGYREIIITGIHVGQYGADLADETDIAAILDKLCCSAPTVRFRLSSIEPLEISDNLLDVMAKNNNFMPHLHIPLQSGSDDILLRMNRRYTTDYFAAIVDRCHSRIQNLAIGIDVLAGFPGETDAHFSETCSFLEELDFTYLHVFPYSRRPGTPAAEFKNHVGKHKKDERSAHLRQLSDEKKLLFYQKFIGTTRPVLVENSRDDEGNLRGFTDNYIPVSFAGHDTLKNTVADVRLDTLKKTEVRGTVITENHER
ncbi:MAG: tRNA (N(6)-L-threonylcarbamoyladenosine(37)-C(2))-methylthiotransferase MtaB [Desulfopila sp.]|jgi:threonylcarbamoyladenosine tRNA methylthiotransferase MtaB|nr:tRNA (N(6)-L-threonylcarbamoyladenosine(37)-C(2))-methylthiotransferase MtaB [Desulfopila sp.]